MKTFEEIIEEAVQVADQRTKVANELRKYATETAFPQISKAIDRLGYKSVNIHTGNQVYSNQSAIKLEYETTYITKFCADKDGSFSFEEATDWNYHENKSEGFQDFDKDFRFPSQESAIKFFTENFSESKINKTIQDNIDKLPKDNLD